MLPEPQVLPITLKNLNTKTTRSGAIPGTLEVCQNVIYDKGDNDGLQGSKRNGLTSLSVDTYSGAIGEVLQIWSTTETLYQSALNGVWGRAGTRWAKTGSQPPGILSAEVRGVGPSYVEFVDGATTTDGYEMVAWQNLHGTNARGVYVHLSLNGQTVEANRLIDAVGIRPKVVSTFNGVNDVLVVFWLDPVSAPGTCIVFSQIYDPATRSWGLQNSTMSIAALGVPAVLQAWYDVKRQESTNDIIIAGNVPATGLLRTSKLTPAGVVGPVVASAFGAQSAGSIVSADYGGYVYISAVNAASTVKLIKLSAITRVDVAEVSVAAGATCGNITGVVDTNTSTAYVAYEVPQASTTQWDVRRMVVDLSTFTLVGALQIWRASVGLVSKACLFRGRPMVAVGYTEALPTAGLPATAANAVTATCDYLITLDDGAIISKALQDTAGGIEGLSVSRADYSDSRSSTLPQAQVVDGGTMRIYTKRIAVPITSFGDVVFYRQPVRLTFTRGETAPPLEIGRSRFLLGGLPFTFDGTDLSGFLVRPPKPTLAPIVAVGFLTPGVYAYYAVYAWTDSLGQLHRSGASTLSQVTLAPGQGQVSFTVETYRLTSLNWQLATSSNTNVANASIEVYRTAVNGEEPRLVLNMDPAPLNDPSVNSITVTDNVADSVQAGGTVLYTFRGELNHVTPPSARCGTVWQNRAVLASLDRQGVLAISFEKLEGAGLTFGAGVEYILPGEPEVAGLVAMGQSLVVFTVEEIFLLAGTLPNLRGEGLNITWTRIPTQNPCLGPMQLALTTDGILYKTTAGFYMFGLGGAIEYAGAPVEAYNALTTKAVFCGNDETRVYCINLDGDACVYDTYWNVWTTFSGHQAQGGCAFGSDYALSIGLVPGSVKVQNSAYDDDGSFVSSRYRFSDFTWGGVEGFACAWQAIVVGEYVGPHVLNVDVVYDLRQVDAVAEHFEENATQYFPPGYATVPYATSFYAGAPGTDGTYQFPFVLAEPYCMSTMVEVYDTEDPDNPGSSGGFRFTDLCFEVGVLPRSNRISPAKRLSPG